jgi:ABC-type glycerol-3-phosphate transport system permease component
MTALHQSRAQRFLLLATLVIGAIVFAFPFANMVATSVKLDEELGAEHFRLLPKPPIPRAFSPYARTDADDAIEQPADLPRATWEAFDKPFVAAVRARIGAWWDAQPATRTLFKTVSRAAALDTLTPIVGAAVLARISDDARKAGATAMLAEVPTLTSDEQVRDAFNDAICRISLGTVRVRMGDYSKRIAGNAGDWRVTSGPGTLLREEPPVAKAGQGALLLQIAPEDPSARTPVTVTMAVRAPPTTAPDEQLKLDQVAGIDRVYVSFQSDQSWSTLQAMLTINGRQYRLAEHFWLAERTWLDLELRVPGREALPTSGRTFYLLEDAGPAPPGAPPLAVSLTFTPNTALGAWWGKISRNYYTAFRQVPIWRYIATSIALAILSIVLVVFGSSLSAYAFARLQFPGRDDDDSRAGDHDPDVPDLPLHRVVQHAAAVVGAVDLRHRVLHLPHAAVLHGHSQRTGRGGAHGRVRLLRHLLVHHAAAGAPDAGDDRGVCVHGLLEQLHGPADLCE